MKKRLLIALCCLVLLVQLLPIVPMADTTGAVTVEKVKKATEGMQIVKTILVKNKLVNLIVKPAK